MSEKLTAWERVEIARNTKRPTSLDYIKYIFDDFMELHGDRISKDDKAICCGLANIGNQNFTVIAEQKGRTTKENIERNFGMPNPESYRKLFKREAEEKGQGEAIAESMLTMAGLHVPIISVVIGEGSSGGALAIGIGNKVYMLENAIYSILSPEGFASILWKDSKRVKEAAEKMKLTSNDLLNFGVIDEIIKEPKVQDYTDEFAEKIAQKIRKEIIKDIKELNKFSAEKIKEQRYEKFRKMGC